MYLPLGGRLHTFLYLITDFGLLPTLTVCDTEWANAVVVIVVVVVDVARRRNNGLYGVQPV